MSGNGLFAGALIATTPTTDDSGNATYKLQVDGVTAGTVSAGTTDSGAPVKIGGYASSAAPVAVTNGQRVNAWYGLNGQAAVGTVQSSANADGLANTAGFLQAINSSSAFPLSVFGSMFNGATWDRSRKPNVLKRVASSAALGNPDFAKASSGDVALFWGQCGAIAAFLQIYNKTSAPTIGTDTPVLTYPIPANAVFSQAIPNGGAYLGTGIAFAFTTDAAGTVGSAAAAITSFALLCA